MQLPMYLPGDDVHFRLMQMSSPPMEITKWILWIIQQSLESAWFSIPDSEPGSLEKLDHISSVQVRQHQTLVCSLLGFRRWCCTVSYKMGWRRENIRVSNPVLPLTTGRCGPWGSHSLLSTSISSLLVGNNNSPYLRVVQTKWIGSSQVLKTGPVIEWELKTVIILCVQLLHFLSGVVHAHSALVSFTENTITTS